MSVCARAGERSQTVAKNSQVVRPELKGDAAYWAEVRRQWADSSHRELAALDPPLNSNGKISCRYSLLLRPCVSKDLSSHYMITRNHSKYVTDILSAHKLSDYMNAVKKSSKNYSFFECSMGM